VIMQENCITAMSKGQGKGFAETVRCTGHQGEGMFVHAYVLPQK
jgi:hypothetical protein